MLRSRAGTALAGMLVSGLLVAGCQSNPEPPPLEETASPSASPSPSPTEAAAPTMPPEAEGTDEAAAKAFVRHYVELVNFAMATGDTAPLKKLARPSCKTCAAITGRIDEVYQDGGRLEGDGWTVISVSVVPTGNRRRPLLAVGINIAPQRAYPSADAASPSESASSRGNLDFRLIARSSGWRISRLDATQ